MVVEKFVDRLITEGVKIKKVETWHNKENEKIFEDIDNGKVFIKSEDGEYCEDKCGGVPFMINQHTNKAICGETTYEELKAWAQEK